MNVENMTTLRDHLVWLRDNNRAYKFDMAAWLKVHDDYVPENYYPIDTHQASIRGLRNTLADMGHTWGPSATECGTVACLAGHAALLGGAPERQPVLSFAQHWLGLTSDEAFNLFFGRWHPSYPQSHGRPPKDVTIQDAIDHLTGLLNAEASPRA